MNERQAILLQMLEDISEVMKAHNIPFFLAYGTLLGAVRHKGFIPWDDDVDLYVFEKDLPRIAEAMKDIGGNYYYHIPSIDNHPHLIYCGENFRKEIESKTAPFIDIFPLIPYPSLGRRIFYRPLFYGYTVLSIIGNGLTNKTLTRLFAGTIRIIRRLMAVLIPENNEKVFAEADYMKWTYDSDSFEPAVWVPYENIEMPIPKKSKEILVTLFGENYMTPPPEDKRGGALGYPGNILYDYDHAFAEKKAPGKRN